MADLITPGPDGALHVTDEPIIPFIEGDGTGVDIWPAAKLVLDAAAAKHGKSVAWKEVLAGQKAFDETGSWLPDETVETFRTHLIGIKGPLTTPIGGGIRSLNVALRQILDLYVCLRPVRWFTGVPSPVLHPEKVDMVIFRENTEDIYAGLEVEEGTPEAKRLIEMLKQELGWDIRPDSGVGIKPISETGSKRLVRASIEYALKRGRKSVTIVHKGNIQKFTEGAFREWGYELATQEFRDQVVTERESWIIGNLDKNPGLSIEDNGKMVEPGLEFAQQDFRDALYKEVKGVLDSIYATHGKGAWKSKLMINDRIADSIFQQIVTRPDEYAVLATPNLNGDYISDAAAAQVGGLGIAPGANIGDQHAIFEATHGTAPKYADKDVINPGSVMLSGVMMFDFMGWHEAARLIEDSLERTILQKKVTYDFERMLEGATKVKTSEFATHMIHNMEPIAELHAE